MDIQKINNIIFLLTRLRLLTFQLGNNTTERFEEEDQIWYELSISQSEEEICSWKNKIREYVWGSENSFEDVRIHWDIKEEDYFISRIKTILGKPLFDLIKSDIIFNDFLKKNNKIDFDQEDYIKQIMMNDFDREKLFSLSCNNINIDANKVSKMMIIQLADRLCEEFNIASLSFSEKISESDCIRYLFEIAYSLEEFSNIIKSKNIGYKVLSLCFEEDGIELSCYNPNFKTIYFTAKNGFGVFAHEWFHFIDHMLMKNLPLLDDGKTFFSMCNVPENKKELFDLKNKINSKFNFKEEEYIRSVNAMRLMLQSFPLAISKIVKESINTHNVGYEILKDLDLMILQIEKLSVKKEEIDNLWYSWKKEAVEKLNKSGAFNDKSFYYHWEYHIILIENICFNEYSFPKNPLWFIFSRIHDLNKKTNYMSRYDEMMARSFEIYISHKVMKKSWISFKHNYDLTYPKDIELTDEMNWWEESLPELLKKIK